MQNRCSSIQHHVLTFIPQKIYILCLFIIFTDTNLGYQTLSYFRSGEIQVLLNIESICMCQLGEP